MMITILLFKSKSSKIGKLEKLVIQIVQTVIINNGTTDILNCLYTGLCSHHKPELKCPYNHCMNLFQLTSLELITVYFGQSWSLQKVGLPFHVMTPAEQYATSNATQAIDVFIVSCFLRFRAENIKCTILRWPYIPSKSRFLVTQP